MYKTTKHPVDCNNDLQMVKEGLRNPILEPVKRVKKSQQEKVDLANAKSSYKQAMKDKKTFKENRDSIVYNIIDSFTPNWGGLVIKMSKL